MFYKSVQTHHHNNPIWLMTPVMESEECKFFFFPLSYFSRSLCLFRVCTRPCITWEGRSLSALIEAAARVSQRLPLAPRAYTLPLCPQSSYSRLSRGVQMGGRGWLGSNGSLPSRVHLARGTAHPSVSTRELRGTWGGALRNSKCQQMNMQISPNVITHALVMLVIQVQAGFQTAIITPVTPGEKKKKKGNEGIALHVSLCAQSQSYVVHIAFMERSTIFSPLWLPVCHKPPAALIHHDSYQRVLKAGLHSLSASTATTWNVRNCIISFTETVVQRAWCRWLVLVIALKNAKKQQIPKW